MVGDGVESVTPSFNWGKGKFNCFFLYNYFWPTLGIQVHQKWRTLHVSFYNHKKPSKNKIFSDLWKLFPRWDYQRKQNGNYLEKKKEP